MVRHGRASDDDDLPSYTVGSAEPSADEEVEAVAHPVAILWLRDPAQRRGWALHRVERVPPDKTPRRMGFR